MEDSDRDFGFPQFDLETVEWFSFHLAITCSFCDGIQIDVAAKVCRCNYIVHTVGDSHRLMALNRTWASKEVCCAVICSGSVIYIAVFLRQFYGARGIEPLVVILLRILVSVGSV